MKLRSIWQVLKDFGRGLGSRSTDYIEFELREMENIFSLLLVGSFVGIPSPPSNISLKLMPYIVREMYVMDRRAGDMDDVSGEIFGVLAREGCCRKGSFLLSWWQRRPPLGFG